MKKVLLVNWDSYPNVMSGGVYSWEKTLVESMSDYEFTVINLLSNPNANGKFAVPPHVRQVVNIPLFGSNRYEEFHTEQGKPLLDKITHTKDRVIVEEFMPLYKQFLAGMFSNDCDPAQLSQTLYRLHKFLLVYDSKKCLEHTLAWEAFLDQLGRDPLYREMTMKEALTAFQIIQRNIQILSLEIPKVDLVHCSLAWFPAMLAILAKIEHGCPIIITEHGVAFRELLLYYNAYLRDEPSNIFWKLFSANVVKTVYSMADVIAPVCYANARWEESFGVDPSKIKVIYNGVDTAKFRPIEVERQDSRPTVACITRVDVFKDIVNLIQSIRYVKETVPDIQCLIYGSSIDLEYSLRCINMVSKLGLQDNIRFVGMVKDPETAYNAADVIVISSITEGFPFAIIEAMACGKGIVATDVGGIREALEGCGLLVRSSHPQELANAIVQLLQDEKLRSKFGAAALKRVQEDFTVEQSLGRYREQYESLLARQNRAPVVKEVAAQ
ncbi:MAG TPA: GT4 family glycosyltransferase PelF [Nitrososphaera sp.]|nr:GT4 family glycosyltransferase PelF [Nitrososphaera sp.]